MNTLQDILAGIVSLNDYAASVDQNVYWTRRFVCFLIILSIIQIVLMTIQSIFLGMQTFKKSS